MSLTLTKIPPKVALAGNDILFKVQTDHHQIVDWQNPVSLDIDTKFLLGAAIINNEQFTLTWNSLSHTFRFRTVPVSDNPNELPIIASITNAYIKILIEKLQAYYYLNRDFNITFTIFDGTHSGFIFTPKTRSPQTKIVGANTLVNMTLTDHQSLQMESAYAADVVNFRINSVIEINDVTLGEDSLPAIPLPPMSYNLRYSYALFNIREYLMPELNTEFLFPEIIDPGEELTFIISRPDICKKYEAKFYEIYGAPPIPYILSTAPETYVLSGGISKEMEAKFNAENTNFWEKLQADMMFLTWAPKIKTTRFNNTEKLFYLNFSHAESLYLMAYVKYIDGTYEIKELSKIGDAIQYLVYEIICSPAIIKINEIDPNKIVKSYTVYLENTAREKISELRQYDLDYAYYGNPREFMFFNSFEVPDTFWTDGEIQKDVGIVASDLNKKLPDFFIDRDFEFEQDRGTESQIFKISVRRNSIPEIEFMREFFLTSKRFEIIQDKLYPINLVSSKISLHKDNDYLYSVDIEFKRAYEDKYFSDLHNQLYDQNNDFNSLDFYLQDFSMS